MKQTIKDLRKVYKAMDDMVDNLGTDDFDDSIPIKLSYNGHDVEIMFCPESVENTMEFIKNLIHDIKENMM